jgi:hypothetical protein
MSTFNTLDNIFSSDQNPTTENYVSFGPSSSAAGNETFPQIELDHYWRLGQSGQPTSNELPLSLSSTLGILDIANFPPVKRWASFLEDTGEILPIERVSNLLCVLSAIF